MSEEILKSITYKEMTINVIMTHGKVRFTVQNPDRKDTVWYFDSMEQGQSKIDSLIAAGARAKTDAVKVKLPVYDSNGIAMTIVGLNRSTGEAKVTNYAKPRMPFKDKGTAYKGDVYPQLPWIHDLLVKQAELNAQLREIHTKLYRVKAHVGDTSYYNSRIAIEQYEPKVRKMEEEIQGKLRLAETIAKTDAKEKVLA